MYLRSRRVQSCTHATPNDQNASEYSEYYREPLTATKTLPAAALMSVGEVLEFDHIFDAG